MAVILDMQIFNLSRSIQKKNCEDRRLESVHVHLEYAIYSMATILDM